MGKQRHQLKKEKRTKIRKFNQNIENLITDYKKDKQEYFTKLYTRKRKRKLRLDEFIYDDRHYPQDLHRNPLYPNHTIFLSKDQIDEIQTTNNNFSKNLSGPTIMNIDPNEITIHQKFYPRELVQLNKSDVMENVIQRYEDIYPYSMKNYIPKEEKEKKQKEQFSLQNLIQSISQLPIKTVQYLLANLLRDADSREEEVQLLKDRIAQLETQMFRLNDQFYQKADSLTFQSPMQSQYYNQSINNNNNNNINPLLNSTSLSCNAPPPPPPPPASLFLDLQTPKSKFITSLKKSKEAASKTNLKKDNNNRPIVTIDMLQGIRLRKTSQEPKFISPRNKKDVTIMNGQPIISLYELSAIKLRATPKQKRSPIRTKTFNGRPIITVEDIHSIHLKETPKKKKSPGKSVKTPERKFVKTPEGKFVKTPQRSPLSIISKSDSTTPMYPRASFKKINKISKSPKTPEQTQNNILKTPKTAPAKSKRSKISSKNEHSSLNLGNNSPSIISKPTSTRSPIGILRKENKENF